MSRLYEKSELWAALVCIAVYVAGTSAADSASAALGVLKLLTMPLHLLMCAALLLWLRKSGLLEKYGLCRPRLSAKRALFYLPLVLAVSCNLWFGVQLRLGAAESLLYILSMLCVGFLEELIFRGLLFKALERENLRMAVIVSSVTFGLGHIINLINGSGAYLLPNLCQVCYAVAFGFLFVTIFIRSGSLLPCIAAHGLMNALSVFAPPDITAAETVVTSIVLCAAAALYTLFLWKNGENEECAKSPEH